LTNQLPFQTLLACYFVLVDAVLLFQYILYKRLSPPRPLSLIPEGTNFHAPAPGHATGQSRANPIIIDRVAPNREFKRAIISIAILGLASLVAAEPVDAPPLDGDPSESIGRMFAWICCAFYLSSRLPQIRENHRRKSTQGINIVLFLAALCGNVFYTIGILTDPGVQGEQRGEFLLNALPYILGSAGYLHGEVTHVGRFYLT
jgi:solute carrier family 66 (lysosomal lysine-arginine transporter), member 1